MDRIEGDFAVCVDSNCNIVNFKKNKLPKNLREGDVLVLKGGKFTIDLEETNKRKEETARLQDELFGEED